MRRKDGEDTRKKIIDAACKVFGEKGYRNATHAEMCDAAGVNIAAINYHFRSKEQLYRTVCEEAIRGMAAVLPPEGDAPPCASAEQRLRAHVRAIILRAHGTARLACYHRLRLNETFHPTGLVDDLWEAWLQKHAQVTLGILRDLMGPEMPEEDLVRCQMSIASQCFLVNHTLLNKNFKPNWQPHVEDPDAVVDHIVRFTLGGLAAWNAETRARALAT